MDVTDITPQLEQLDVDLDRLEEVLKPLLGDLGDVSSQLPLLDKAKLYVLATYAAESLLYCMRCSLSLVWYGLFSSL
jgi:exosome complex protein LRP1